MCLAIPARVVERLQADGYTVTAPQFGSSLCDSLDDTNIVGSPNTASGCIAILAAKKDDHSPVAKERGNDDRQD